MILQTRKPRTILRSAALPGIAGATLLLSLLTPTVASAAERSPNPSTASSSATEITPEQLSAVSKKQISAANSGTEKFSAGDLVAQVRDQIEKDRKELERKAAEEAAKKKAEAEAKAKARAEAKAKKKAEEEAKAKAAAEAAAKAKAAEEAAAAEQLSSAYSAAPSSRSASPSAPLYTGGGSKNEWLTAAGIPESDWSYVDYIVSHESGWNPNAVNASSGAGGLVQALPCGKVAGGCFDPVSNLKWADGYAKARYGSWAGAYAFWSSNHWW